MYQLIVGIVVVTVITATAITIIIISGITSVPFVINRGSPRSSSCHSINVCSHAVLTFVTNRLLSPVTVQVRLITHLSPLTCPPHLFSLPYPLPSSASLASLTFASVLLSPFHISPSLLVIASHPLHLYVPPSPSPFTSLSLTSPLFCFVSV